MVIEEFLRGAMGLAVAGFVLAFSLCTPAGAAPAPAQPVDVDVSATERIIQQVRVTGTVTSPRSANLSPAVAGLVASLAVEAGDRVAAGDELMQLDVEIEALSLDRARAERASAEANLADARRRLAEAERLGTDIAESEVASRQTALATAQADLDAARAAEALQGAVVRRHTLKAPFDGVVVGRSVDLGEWVTPGDDLLELVAIDNLWFDFQVPQSFYPRVAMETALDLRLDALEGDRRIAGKVRAIIPVKNPGARTFLLRAVADTDESLPITPGMSARAILKLDTGRDAVSVPRDALLRYPDGRTTVWTLEEGETGTSASEQVVQPGLEFDGRVEIQSGLEAGARVVTRGNESLVPGQRVRIR